MQLRAGHDQKLISSIFLLWHGHTNRGQMSEFEGGSYEGRKEERKGATKLIGQRSSHNSGEYGTRMPANRGVIHTRMNVHACPHTVRCSTVQYGMVQKRQKVVVVYIPTYSILTRWLHVQCGCTLEFVMHTSVLHIRVTTSSKSKQ